MTFAIDPPAGVMSALVLLDASTVQATGVGTAQDPGLVDATCAGDPAGDDNAVICTGPDAPIGAASRLYLTLRVAAGAPAGTFPIPGDDQHDQPGGRRGHNTAVAQLTIAAADPPVTAGPTTAPTTNPPNDNSNHHYGGGPLPRTGQNLTGLVALAPTLVGAGVAARVTGRDRPRRRRS